MAQRLKTDWILFFTVIAMVCSGVLIVYSASAIMAQMGPYHSAWHYVQRQAAWAIIALLIMMGLKHTHYRKLQTPAVALSAISVALFLLVAVYFMDRAITAGCVSADRWAYSRRSWRSLRWWSSWHSL
jgi:cell division protein FtsW